MFWTIVGAILFVFIGIPLIAMIFWGALYFIKSLFENTEPEDVIEIANKEPKHKSFRLTR